MFKLGVFTDEVSQDFERALHVIKKDFQVNYVELRTMWNKNLIELADTEIKYVKKLLDKYNLQVSCVASPFLKCDLIEEKGGTKKDTFFKGEGGYKTHLSILERSIELAKIFSTKLIRSFSFWRVKDSIDYETWHEIVYKIKFAVSKVEKEGLILALENEHECNIATGAEACKLMKEINSSHLGLIWDPGNAFFAGETPYPDGYNLIRRYIVHVHIKDALYDKKAKKYQWVPIGKGEIDLKGQLRALLRDKYEGIVSLETHYRSKKRSEEEDTRESFRELKNLLNYVNAF